MIYRCARRNPAGRTVRFRVSIRGVAMDDLRLTLDDTAFLRQLSAFQVTQLPKAGSLALNDTAYDVLKEIQNRMDVVFDRPTRFTKNALMVWRAKPDNLEAQVKERPTVGSRHYLKIQETGGIRPKTGLEKLMASNLPYGGIVGAIIPASGARLDGFGNWSMGERNQVLSQLQAQRDTTANETAASRKRKRGKSPGRYFVPKSDKGGVYRRSDDGTVTKVLTITDHMPSYKPRLGFYDTAADLWAARLPKHLARHLAKGLLEAK
jgi:hypothetical protein